MKLMFFVFMIKSKFTREGLLSNLVLFLYTNFLKFAASHPWRNLCQPPFLLFREELAWWFFNISLKNNSLCLKLGIILLKDFWQYERSVCYSTVNYNWSTNTIFKQQKFIFYISRKRRCRESLVVWIFFVISRNISDFVVYFYFLNSYYFCFCLF